MSQVETQHEEREYAAGILEMARPEMFRINAFRVAELPVDATARDLVRRQQMVEMATNAGLPVPSGSGRALPLMDSTDPEALREAMQRLRDPERRLVEEFFWFWPHRLGESGADEALTALAQGEPQKAEQIWLRQESYQSDANVSMHNLAVLSHTAALDLEHMAVSNQVPRSTAQQGDVYWQQAFQRWKILLQHEGFWSRLTARIRDLDDPRLTTGTARRIRTALPLTLLLANAQLAVQAAEQGDRTEAKRQLKIMQQISGFDRDVCDEALRRALAPIRERIRASCAATKMEATADPAHCDQAARRLLDQTRPLLDVLDCLLSSKNMAREGAHDEVAVCALQAQIAFGNKTQDWKTSCELLESTMPLAGTQSVRARLKENLDIVTRNLENTYCFFCGENPSVDGAPVEVKMYKETMRLPTLTGTQIQWQKLTIKVPRCNRCKGVHSRVNSFAGVGATLGTIAGCVGCIAVVSEGSGDDQWCGGLMVLAVGAAIGSGVGYAIGRALSPRGIKAEDKKNQFSTVLQMTKQGWKFGEKPSDVKT